MADRNPPLRDAALLARRATMRVNLDLVNDLAGREWADAVQAVLDAPPNGDVVEPYDKSEDTIAWWHQRISSPSSGLHERMTFFWHTVLTSHRYASGEQALIAPQLNMLRANAMGNYRTMLQAFVVDGALIRYLDADSSSVRRPNENLARELMELFTFGLGNYGEDDVRAAALAMTGWRINEDDNISYFDPERANTEPVTFLGESKNWDVTSIVDRLCDHPATAARVASLVWYHFIGAHPDGGQAAELGTWWQGRNLEIKPLLQRILNEPAFRETYYSRPRSGFEFYSAMQSVLGMDPTELWRSRQAGQALYEPPNVAGWPGGERWLNPDSMLRRSDSMFSYDFDKMAGGSSAGVEEILDRCGLFVVSEATLGTINNAGADLDEGSLAQLRWRIALSSPEFQLT